MNPLWNEIAGHTLSDEQLRQLDHYLDLLIEKNRVLNLTRITDRAEAEIKHVADALTLLPLIDARARSTGAITLADIGTGGGIPGAILAIARPRMPVTLIDSTRKKLDAVQNLCDAVGLTNVRTLHTRIEQVHEHFDFITARAVAELSLLIRWCLPMLQRGGVLLAMKGPKVYEEFEQAGEAVRRARLEVKIEPVAVPALPNRYVVSAAKK